MTALVLAAAAPFAACSADEEPAGQEVSSESAPTGSIAPAPGQVELLTGNVSAQSELFLEDGVVTTSEMQSSVLSFLDCLRTNGVEGDYAYDLEVSSTLATNLYIPGDDDPSGAALDEISFVCQVQYIRDVDTAYDQTLGERGGSDGIVATRLATCLADVLGDQAVDGLDTLAELRVVANEAIENDESGAVSQCLSSSSLGPYRPL